MPYDHYDTLEARDPDDRERDFFVRLPDFIALAVRARMGRERKRELFRMRRMVMVRRVSI